MPATKKESISPFLATWRALKKRARRDRVLQASTATSLIERALEIEEDEAWSAVAAERARTLTRFVSHKAAWEYGGSV